VGSLRTWQWIWALSVLLACAGGDKASGGGGAHTGDGGRDKDASQPSDDDDDDDDDDDPADADDDDSDADQDAGDDGDDAAHQARCASLPCAQGQRCDASGDIALCVPSCDGVTCQTGFACQIVGDVGTCQPACQPRCSSGQRCEAGASGAACMNNSCASLDCKATEACVAASDGPGFVCVDNRCSDDLGCALSQSCQQGICVGDRCEPGVRTCQGAGVLECLANGSGTIERVSCPSAPGLVSSCLDRAGAAACSCRDDWDCPANTNCEQGVCTGSGRAPTCFLPPLPFASLLPAAEPGFPWGGDDADGYDGSFNAKDATSGVPSRDAKGLHPFRRHAQVSATPIVANLDDDNGDGLVDERDRPEILFTGFCDRNYFNHGVLRALHGGGERAGQELFARCGSKLWHEGDPIADDLGVPVANASCACGEGDIEPTGAVAVGDLDREDGLPEIVVLGHLGSVGSGDVGNTRLMILSNTGELISDNTVTSGLPGADPAVTLADLDGQGYAEIVVGGRVFVLEKVAGRLTVSKTFVGDKMQGINNGQGAVSCVADLDADGRLEIVAGGTAYKLPRAPATCPTDLGTLEPEARAYCEGKLHVFWDKGIEGFCAIADVLTAPAVPEPPTDLNHPLDGKPEVVLIANGHLRIFDGLTGNERLDATMAGSDGGPPNIDDFDGDGFPEVGTAFANYYAMYDLQTPTAACPAWPSTLDGVPNSTKAEPLNGARAAPSLSCNSHAACGDTSQFACSDEGSCVCLHNAWKSTTQDASSRVTGSSVFDFNGDGTAEVVYNDECYFRIYEGKNGRVYQRLDSQSPTRIEYPVVADVDSDGNAEIVFSGSNGRSEKCANVGAVHFLDGINVIGDPTDRWVSARRIWNQHAYHVTNVLEQGTVPSHEVENWKSYGGRSYNTYRSNLPPYGNVAPDLAVMAVQVSSPNVVCGEALSTDIRIAARVVNQGDLRVGENVGVRFLDQADQVLGEKLLGVALEPGAETFVSLDYHAQSQAALPTRVKVVVDADQAERECNENNNRSEAALTVNEQTPELSITLSALTTTCPKRQLRVSVKNEGQATVPSTSVRLFAGNPSEGGVMLSMHNVGPIPAAGSASLDVDVDVGPRDVTVYAVVDAERKIMECNDGNNTATLKAECYVPLY
jgi:hypothetical protein